MALDNVVPIDADTARLLERRKARFRWFVAFLGLAYLSVLVPVLIVTPLPPLGPLALLAVLVVLAEHRFVLFGDETSMSASIIVVVASVFVFADSSPLAGPLLIGSFGGLYLPHLRRGAFALMSANASSLGLSAALAASALILAGHLARSSGTCLSLLQAATVVVVYWSANSTLIGSASAFRQGSPTRESIRLQASSEWQLLFLVTAAATMISGPLNTWSALPALALCLAAFEVRLHTYQRAAPFRATGSWSFAIIVGSSAALALSGRVGLSVALIGLFLITADSTDVQGRITIPLASMLVALAAAGGVAALGGNVIPMTLLAACSVFVTTYATRIALNQRRFRTRLPLVVVMGLAIPSLRELTLITVVITALVVFADVPEHAAALTTLAVMGVGLATARRCCGSVRDPEASSAPRSSEDASL